MYHLLKKINKAINSISEKIIIVALMGMTLAIFLQVISRYILQSPISWTEEIAIYLFIWLTFIGAAVTVRDKTHVRVAEFVSRIRNQKIFKAITILAEVFTGILFMLLVIYGTRMAAMLISLKQSSPTIPFLNVSIIYIAIPLGSLLALLHLAEIIIDTFREQN